MSGTSASGSTSAVPCRARVSTFLPNVTAPLARSVSRHLISTVTAEPLRITVRVDCRTAHNLLDSGVRVTLIKAMAPGESEVGSRLSLVIADDHPLMRAGIKEILAADRLCHLVAIAETGAECLDAIQRLQPDLALIDLKISRPGAAHILRALIANGSQTRICFLAEGKIPPKLLQAAKLAAAEFANERSPDDLRSRLREIASELSSKPSANRPAAVRPSAPAQKSERLLTSRQKQIVTMLKLGASNRDIARALGVVEGTVKVHLHRIFQRLGVANRTQLAAQSFAVEQPPQPDLKPGATRKT